MRAVRLRVSDMAYAVGIDVSHPRFSWNCEGGITQIAFRVVAAGEKGDVLFDSGKVESGQMHCRYAGKMLTSRMRVTWKVCLWDEDNRAEWSDESVFEMGLLNPADWKAKWIHGIGTDQKKHLPADYYRKAFHVDEDVKRARIYATALGVYTASVNGNRVSSVLAPGTSEYEKTLYYQTYDITPYLRQGETCEIIFSVADGWYKGKLGADQYEYLYGTQTKLLAQIEIEYLSGRREIIGTDSSFQWSNDGPVRFADLKDGEIYDAGRKPSFAHNAETDESEKKVPIPSNAPLILEQEEFRSTLEISPTGKNILNFGQNMAGYLKFKTSAPKGTKIRIRLFEALDHGEYSNNSLSFPDGDVEAVKQEILYTASGQCEEYVPSFFYSGFQYALVEGLSDVNPDDFRAVAVYSDLEYGSSFKCSNKMIDRFYRNTVWSMKSNFVDVPTDCPQREKSGWTGDAQVFCRTAQYFADTKAFYRKWFRDIRDCQKENGMVINVNPRVLPEGTRMDAVNGSCGWADAAVIIPYTLWKMTGDDSVILENYEVMHGWKSYVIELCKNKSMFHLKEDSPFYPMKAIYERYKLSESRWNRYIPEYGIHWGEWCVPKSEEPEELDPATVLIAPKQEVTCAYTHYSMSMLAEMLSSVGKNKEAEECREYAEGSKRAYHEHWIKNGTVNTNHMAELVRPIALGLADEEEKKNIARALNKMVTDRNYKVGTGFLSTPFLLQTLADAGYTESAYRMLENENAPGWLAMPAHGATTVWEEYECYDEHGTPMPRSFNHYSLGAVCSFLFDTVCGIKITGENKFEIKPKPGGTLTYAEAQVQTAYGKVKSSWNLKNGKIEYRFSIPSNTIARVILPDERCYKLKAGVYTFV